MKKLEKVLALMERGDSVSREQVGDELGVSIAAHLSVPTAIYSFVRALQPIEGVEVFKYAAHSCLIIIIKIENIGAGRGWFGGTVVLLPPSNA